MAQFSPPSRFMISWPKRHFFGRILNALEPGGAFVNTDHVAGATGLIKGSISIRGVAAPAASASPKMIFERIKVERAATVCALLRWLTMDGFRRRRLCFQKLDVCPCFRASKMLGPRVARA
jgi:hypothetical protein